MPIAGINAEDLEVRLKTSTDGTGSGEKCSILSTSSDNADPNASYPDAGTVSADILLERGGPQLPEGECIVTVLANGMDGIDNDCDSVIDAADPNCQ